MTTTSNFFSLPDELLLYVLVHVNNADILRVRLVCRRLEKAAIEEFGRRFLSHLLVLHDERSVAKLQTIAKQARLNRHVWNITISGELSKGEMRNQSERCINWHQDLTRAIQGFPKLEIITIDNLNLAITTDASEEFSHGEEICSCILSGATQVFQSLRLSTEPRLNLRISADDASPYTHLFDPRAQSWKENSAPKVSSLALVTHDGGDHTWELDLLDSLWNLQHFDIEGNVPDSTWAKLSWPMLSTTELRDLYLPTDGFIAFIMRHSTTLSSVGLEEITLYEGTWVDPLQKVIEMNQLSRLSLCSLYQMDSSAKVSDSFELNFPAMEREVELLDRNDFDIAVEILNHHFWTTTSDEPGDTRYLVDLRLVKAFVDGEIGFEHGHWKF